MNELNVTVQAGAIAHEHLSYSQHITVCNITRYLNEINQMHDKYTIRRNVTFNNYFNQRVSYFFNETKVSS